MQSCQNSFGGGVSLIEQLRRDFRPFRDDCMEIFLYGSYTKGEATEWSDVDYNMATRNMKSIIHTLGGTIIE